MDRTGAHAAPGVDTLVAHRFRRVLGRFPTGVAPVEAGTSEGPTGTAVNSTSVSPDPAAGVLLRRALAVHVATHRGHGRVRRRRARGAPLGGEPPFRPEGRRRLRRGGRPARCDRGPVPDGVAALVDCGLHAVLDAGDHVIVPGRVVDLDADEGIRPSVLRGGDSCTLQSCLPSSPRAGVL